MRISATCDEDHDDNHKHRRGYGLTIRVFSFHLSETPTNLQQQLKGYKKEVIEGIAINEETGEEEPANTKIYYHNWCFQLKEFKQAHQEGWQKVMSGLLGHFRAIELAEQRRKDDEARARREAALKADEARRAADEKRREAEEQRRIEEEERLAAEEARLKKEASMTYKMGKKMSAFKKAVTAPCKSKKAVNEDATGDAPEQFPNYDY